MNNDLHRHEHAKNERDSLPLTSTRCSPDDVATLCINHENLARKCTLHGRKRLLCCRLTWTGAQAKLCSALPAASIAGRGAT